MTNKTYALLSLAEQFSDQLRYLKTEIDKLFFQMFSISYYHELGYYQQQFVVVSKKVDALHTKIVRYLSNNHENRIEFQLLIREAQYIKNRLEIFFSSFKTSEKIIQLSKELSSYT